MKRFFMAIFTTVLTAVCMITCSACDMFDDIFGGKSGVHKEYYENCAVFTFDNFDSKISIKLDRTGLDEGAVHYYVNLEEGALRVEYAEVGFIHSNQFLAEFTADGEMPIYGSNGYVEGDKISITFEAFSPVCGEIVIAFTQNALNVVKSPIS